MSGVIKKVTFQKKLYWRGGRNRTVSAFGSNQKVRSSSQKMVLGFVSKKVKLKTKTWQNKINLTNLIWKKSYLNVVYNKICNDKLSVRMNIVASEITALRLHHFYVIMFPLVCGHYSLILSKGCSVVTLITNNRFYAIPLGRLANWSNFHLVSAISKGPVWFHGWNPNLASVNARYSSGRTVLCLCSMLLTWIAMTKSDIQPGITETNF